MKNSYYINVLQVLAALFLGQFTLTGCAVKFNYSAAPISDSTATTSNSTSTSDSQSTVASPVTIRHISKSFVYSVCAALSNGSVKCWGETGSGALGLGLTGQIGDEANEMGDNLTTVSFGTGRYATQIAIEGSDNEFLGYHACALLDDGSIKCWGHNTYGQLGIGSTTDKGPFPGDMGSSLESVDLGTGRTATQVVVGQFHSCALLDNATVKCWGQNNSGQLGQGNTTLIGDNPGEMGDLLPAIDLGTGRTATAISSGISHVCALLDNSTVKCWGHNQYGQLGQGSNSHKGDGAGEMGDSLAAINLGTGRTATAISAGGWFTCAILDNSDLKCWGYNSSGQLGLDDSSHRGDGAGEMGDSLPALNLGTGRTASTVLGTLYSTCVLLDDASVKCWGYGTVGTLGQGNTNNLGDGAGEMGDSLAAINLGTGRTATEIYGTGGSVCAKLDNSQLKCWGRNNYGQLGIGSSAHKGDGAGEMGDSLAAVNLGTGRTALRVAPGYTTACAIRDDQTTVCWGHNGSGIIKNENSVIGDSLNEMGSNLATLDLGTGFSAVKVEMGAPGFGCALSEEGGVKCWGINNSGQLGQGNTSSIGDGPGEMGDNLPYVNLGTGIAATDISVGHSHVCVIVESGKVKCWGLNSYGGLGIGNANHKGDGSGEMGDNLAYTDLGTGRTAKKLALGYFSSCAILDDDTVKCWGYNTDGQLGLGDTSHRGLAGGQMGDSLPTVDLGTGRTAKAISAGAYFYCALLNDNSIKCWGQNGYGSLGYGDANNRGDGGGEMGDNLLPVDLGTSRHATSLVAGTYNVCAILDNNTLKCWGHNSYGQAGLGDGSHRGDAGGEMGDALPTVNIGTGRTPALVTTGSYTTYVIDDLGQLKSFGINGAGQLGQAHRNRIGDGAGEMGDALILVDLGLN